jgi:hypothetical protein
MNVQVANIHGGLDAASLAQSGGPSPGQSGGLPALDNVFNVADTLTDNDKNLVGWDPSSGKINDAAIALAQYRQNGTLTGEVGQDFVNTLKNSVANGGWPANPAALMSKGGQQAQLSSETYSALFNIVNQPSTGAASSEP